MEQPAIGIGGVSFTPKQWAIFGLMAQGMTDQQIAAKLGERYRVVTNTVAEIFSKLNIGTRTEAASWYYNLLFGTTFWRIAYTARTHDPPVQARRTHKQMNIMLDAEIAAGHYNLSILNRAKAMVLYEQSGSIRERLSKEAVIEPTKHFHRRILGISKQYKIQVSTGKDKDKDELYGLGYYILGDAYYIAGIKYFDKAAKSLTTARQYVQSPDSQLCVLRVLAIVLSQLGEESQVKKIGNEVEQIISRTDNLERICETYEGLARSYASINSRKENKLTIDMLAKAQAYVTQLDTDGLNAGSVLLRKIQLLRTEIVVHQKLGDSSKNTLCALAETGLKLSSQLPYHRFPPQFQAILD